MRDIIIHLVKFEFNRLSMTEISSTSLYDAFIVYFKSHIGFNKYLIIGLFNVIHTLLYSISRNVVFCQF